MPLFHGKNIRMHTHVSRSVLVRLTMTLLLPSALLFLILTLQLPALYTGAMQDDIHAMSQLTLANMDTSLIALEERARSIAYQTFSDKAVRSVLLAGKQDREAMVQAAVRLRTVISLNPDIDSIQLVRRDEVLLDQGGSPLFEAAYRDVAPAIRRAPALLALYPRTLTQDRSERSMLTILYAAAFPVRPTDNCILVNYSREALLRSFDAGTDDGSRHFLIMDREGHMLFSDMDEERGAPSPSASRIDMEPVKAVLAENRPSGTCETQVDGKAFTVHYRTSEKERYVLLYFTETSQLYGRLAGIRRVLLLACAALLMALLLVVAWISRKLYTPIGNLYANIRRELGRTDPARALADETKALSALFRHTIERLDNLEQQQVDLRAERADRLVGQLLDATDPVEETLFSQSLAQCGVETGRLEAGMPMLVQLGHGKDWLARHAAVSRRFQLDALSGILREQLPPDCVTFQPRPGHLLIVCPWDALPTDPDAFCAAALAKIVEGAGSLIGLELTACHGSRLRGPFGESVRISWQALCRTAEERFDRGYGHVLRVSDAPAAPPQDPRRPAQCIASLAESLQQGARVRYDTTTASFLDLLSPMTREERLHWLAKCLLETQWNERAARNADIPTLSATEAHERAERMETRSEVAAMLDELYRARHPEEGIEKRPSAESLGVVAVRLAEAMCCDAGLSASALADRLGITPQYFSRIFHQQTGMSFPDYIGAMRLEKAHALLLKDRTASIRDICAKTGFNSVSYFGAAFRRRYGCSPSEARVRAAAEEAGENVH